MKVGRECAWPMRADFRCPHYATAGAAGLDLLAANDG